MIHFLSLPLLLGSVQGNRAKIMPGSSEIAPQEQLGLTLRSQALLYLKNLDTGGQIISSEPAKKDNSIYLMTK
ncbi:hypothetical protein [Poritiphilus flavus]|uniref:Uncharacterized protein n=1 Tax=Poritiphilus flavus TaxID=2697053 RepID=A0A6L9EBT5_9FLAO|nr:hypothetical protein [Poritiphilus flavus]NAS12031.1 hypothetical protein [Poritiphilus flavus]